MASLAAIQVGGTTRVEEPDGTAIVYHTEVVLDARGDVDLPGSLTLSYGSGRDLEEAARRAGDSLVLSWEEALEEEQEAEDQGKQPGLEEEPDVPEEPSEESEEGAPPSKDIQNALEGGTLEIPDEEVPLAALELPAGEPEVFPVEDAQPGLDYSYRDVLGGAIRYGITAREIQKNGHMDSNFAASRLSSDGGNINPDTYTNSEGSPVMVGSITNTLRVDDKNNVVFTTEEAANSITFQPGSGGSYQYLDQSAIEAQVEGMLSDAARVSQILAGQKSYSVMKYGTYWDGTANVEGWYVDQNQKELDLSNLPGGTYYIDGDTFLNKNDVKIKKNPDQTVVFNLTGETVNLKRFEAIDAQTGQSMSSATSDHSVYSFASTIIFNMPNAKTVQIESAIFGVLLAPNGAVAISSTSSGWIVADTVSNPGGEWHFLHPYEGQDQPQPLSVTVEARKTLDGEAPEEGTEFRFRVERWEETAGTWVEEQTVCNSMDQILVQETFTQAGDYYYRLSEIDEGGAYQYDATQYIVKIEVTETQSALQAVQTVYKTGEMDQVGEDTKTSALLFQNTTVVESPGYVLPETGGSGTFVVTAGGMLLMAASSLMYTILRRKGRA